MSGRKEPNPAPPLAVKPPAPQGPPDTPSATSFGRASAPGVDAASLEPCNAPAQIEGTDGPITLGRCFLAKGHHPLTPHSAPYDRLAWGGPDAAKES